MKETSERERESSFFCFFTSLLDTYNMYFQNMRHVLYTKTPAKAARLRRRKGCSGAGGAGATAGMGGAWRFGLKNMEVLHQTLGMEVAHLVIG